MKLPKLPNIPKALVYRIQVIISVYINIGGFCKLELFGDTNAVHVTVDDKGYSIDQVIDGETVAEVKDGYWYLDGKKTEYVASNRVEPPQGYDRLF